MMNKYMKLTLALGLLLGLSAIKIVSKDEVLENEKTLIGFAVDAVISDENYEVIEENRFFKAIQETPLSESDELITRQEDYDYNDDEKTIDRKISVELNVIPKGTTEVFSLYEVYVDGNDNYEYYKASENISFDLDNVDTGGSIFLNKEYIDQEGFTTTLYFEVAFIPSLLVESNTLYEFNSHKEIVNTIKDINSIDEYKLSEEFLMLETTGTDIEGENFRKYEIITKDMVDEEYGYDIEYPVSKNLKYMVKKYLPISK